MTFVIFHSLDLYKMYFHDNLLMPYLVRGDIQSIKDTEHGVAATPSMGTSPTPKAKVIE
jgi:hypothetical protein